MNPTRSSSFRLTFGALLAACSWVPAAAQSSPPPVASPATESSAVDAPAATAPAAAQLRDREIEPYRLELLDLAFDAVSRMPLVPHIKNRSRAQFDVVAALFDLGQPRLGLRRSIQIADFRRGLGYVAYARECARQGIVSEAERYLGLADKVGDEVMRDPDQQAWRRDRVRAHAARVWLELGHEDRAEELVKGLQASEVGVVTTTFAENLDKKEIADWLTIADRTLGGADFESVINTLRTCGALYGRFFDDADLRGEFERRAATAYPKLPIGMRIELLMSMSDQAVDHGDLDAAKTQLQRIDERMEHYQPHEEAAIALHAQMARLRHRVGDIDAARAEAAAAVAEFDRVHDDILLTKRADALVPVAEAYHAIGDDAEALRYWERAIAETEPNPNSRPRGDDLVLVCTSMARAGVEPGEGLLRRLHALADLLGTDGNPW